MTETEEAKMFVAGIDDTGTSTSLTEGWSFFLIPSDAEKLFCEKSRQILKETKLKSFHGKDFKRRFSNAYAAFLKLIGTTIKQYDSGLAAVVLMNDNWKRTYRSFCNKLITGSYSLNNIQDSDLTQASVKLADPLFTLQRIASGYEGDVRVEIDKDVVLGKVPELELKIRGVKLDPTLPVAAFYNAYRDKQFPKSPRLAKGELTVRPAADSYLIQAADIVGNFCLAHAQHCLGVTSKNVKAKVEVFLEAFGDVDCDEAFHNVELEDGELKLKTDGTFKFMVQTN